ncbi:hypothetical protein [Nocardioides panacihumi]|uniref:hypothetical protein n=1 Tax=Nocardioides panacihumi TaxID=400774 RepID=UPI0031DA2F9E
MDTGDRVPAYLVALVRHVEDLRDGTHGGADERGDKEAVFVRAADWLAPVAVGVLEEVDATLLLSTGEVADTGLVHEDDGTLARSWTLSWPEQRDRGLEPVTLRVWFGGGFHHPHLRGATVHDWPLNVDEEGEARDLLPLLRSAVAADVHHLVFQSDWRLIPAVGRRG